MTSHLLLQALLLKRPDLRRLSLSDDLLVRFASMSEGLDSLLQVPECMCVYSELSAIIEHGYSPLHSQSFVQTSQLSGMLTDWAQSGESVSHTYPVPSRH